MSMYLDSWGWSEHGQYWAEAGSFSEIVFGGIKHTLYHHRNFAERYGPALVDFMVAASWVFGASRSYLYDDYRLEWRLNAHAIYYHPIDEYRHDLERLQHEWQNGTTYLNGKRDWSDADFGSFTSPAEVKEVKNRLDRLMSGETLDIPLPVRLHEVDYVLDQATDTLVLRGFPDPVGGYVTPFFLP